MDRQEFVKKCEEKKRAGGTVLVCRINMSDIFFDKYRARANSSIGFLYVNSNLIAIVDYRDVTEIWSTSDFKD